MIKVSRVRSGSLFFSASLLFLIAGNRASQAQVGVIRAHLKVGLDIETTVHEVTEWGFWLTSGRGLLYRQLDSLSTQSDSLVSEVKQRLPAVRVAQEEATFTLHFEGVDVPVEPYQENNALRLRELMGGASIGDTGDIEVHFNAATRFTGPLMFQLGHTLGWSLSERGGFLGGFTAGLGLFYQHDRSRWMLLFNAWKKYFQHTSARNDPSKASILASKPEAYSGALYYHRSLGAGRFVLSTGVRYYFKNIEFQGTVPRYSVIVIAGVRL